MDRRAFPRRPYKTSQLMPELCSSGHTMFCQVTRCRCRAGGQGLYRPRQVFCSSLFSRSASREFLPDRRPRGRQAPETSVPTSGKQKQVAMNCSRPPPRQCVPSSSTRAKAYRSEGDVLTFTSCVRLNENHWDKLVKHSLTLVIGSSSISGH